jgi:hypothetical protein
MFIVNSIAKQPITSFIQAPEGLPYVAKWQGKAYWQLFSFLQRMLTQLHWSQYSDTLA